jgi:hypothetical protein
VVPSFSVFDFQSTKVKGKEVMKVVKKTPEYTVYEKRSKRYAVKGSDKNWINGEEKVKILLAEKLIEVKLPAPKVEEAEEVAAEAVAEEAPAQETAKEASSED